MIGVVNAVVLVALGGDEVTREALAVAIVELADVDDTMLKVTSTI